MVLDSCNARDVFLQFVSFVTCVGSRSGAIPKGREYKRSKNKKRAITSQNKLPMVNHEFTLWKIDLSRNAFFYNHRHLSSVNTTT